MLEKASKSSTRDYLGFSASDIADGISKLAVNESNSKQVRLICFGYTVFTVYYLVLNQNPLSLSL